MTEYTYTINGTDFSGYVARGSYSTGLIPVYGDTITTLDGVDHVVIRRYKGFLTHDVNALTETQLETLAAALMDAPLTVTYHCLQRGTDVTATMIPGNQTARHLADCLYGDEAWNKVETITLTEL